MGGVKIWLFRQILTPIPGPATPYPGHSNLSQKFHRHRCKQPHLAAWGLPRGERTNMTLPCGELLPLPTLCRMQHRPPSPPAPTQGKIGLPISVYSKTSCIVFPPLTPASISFPCLPCDYLDCKLLGAESCPCMLYKYIDSYSVCMCVEGGRSVILVAQS